MHFNGSLVHTKHELGNYSVEKLLSYGKEINQMLSRLGGKHTFHPSAHELAGSMLHRHAILLTDESGEEVHGFVKATPWIAVDYSRAKGDMVNMDPYKVLEENNAKVVAVEVGSLVIKESQQGKKKARKAVVELVNELANTYKGVPRVAVITNDNTASMHVFRALEWQEIDAQEAYEIFGINILDGWDPLSVIYVDRSSIISQ